MDDIPAVNRTWIQEAAKQHELLYGVRLCSATQNHLTYPQQPLRDDDVVASQGIIFYLD